MGYIKRENSFSHQSLLCVNGVHRFHTFFYLDYATRSTWLRCPQVMTGRFPTPGFKLKHKVLKYYVEVKLWRHKIPTNCVSVILRHILGPDSLKTFPGTCNRNFLYLQMISFEFLRAAFIGWTVSRGQHFVHMTRPGQQLVSHDLFLILWRLLWYDKSTSSTELNSPITIRSYFFVGIWAICVRTRWIRIHIINVSYII